MKTNIRLGVSLYIIIMSIITANLIFGTTGMIAYNEMLEYKEKIEKNIINLERVNEELIMESNKLITQPDEISLQARKLGWIKDTEGIIMLRGLNLSKPGYAIGKLLSHESNHESRCRNYMIISFLAGLIFYILTGILSEMRIYKKIQ